MLTTDHPAGRAAFLTLDHRRFECGAISSLEAAAASSSLKSITNQASEYATYGKSQVLNSITIRSFTWCAVRHAHTTTNRMPHMHPCMHTLRDFAHISAASPGGQSPGSPDEGTHGLGREYAAKICHGEFSCHSGKPPPGIYPRDMLLLCCHEVQRQPFSYTC